MVAGLALASAPRATAHSGPPYPIVQDRSVGPYRLSIWTDPDASDDGSAVGRFWVIVQDGSGGPAPTTRVTVSVRALDRAPATEGSAAALPDARAGDRYFARNRLDHEGRWLVAATVEGPLGRATTTAEVEATYDARPSPATLPFLVLPFVLVGGLWLRGLVSRGRRRA